MTNAKMYLKWKNEEMQMSVEDFAVKGKHNQYNSMAASMAAIAIDIRKEKIREALQTFQSLEHRMESVATIKGVEFIKCCHYFLITFIGDFKNPLASRSN